MKTLRLLAIRFVAPLILVTLAGAQTWTPLTHQPTFGASTALQLTDGTIMVQEAVNGYGTGQWWRLTPDNTGSYVNGTWSQLASMPSGYAPTYYASAVLVDGRVIVEGGEYNLGNSRAAETSLGAIYDPQSNTWTSLSAPPNWDGIGDGQSAVLQDGTFMLGNCGVAQVYGCPATQQALLNPSTQAWTGTGAGKADINAEEGWTLLPVSPALPYGGVMTIDVYNSANLSTPDVYEVYTVPPNPDTPGSWTSPGSTGVPLAAYCSTAEGSGWEIGPAVLRPDGTVLAIGATSNTAIYTPPPYGYGLQYGKWTKGPTFSSGLDVADGPAALLPSGNVLVDTSPGCYNSGSQFFEISNSPNPIAAPNLPNARNDSSFMGRMLVLPTGQVLFTDGSSDVEIYTASGTYNYVWQPTITSYPTNITIGASWYPINGTQFNGLSQGAMYGDDAQSATNYPLVRITNYTTGHVFYMFTHNHSSMGVATAGVNVSTLFDPPLNMERGWSYLVVVANGIPSAPVNLNVD
jgi:hypothetical protein